MSIKQEIETWVTALAAYDNNEFDNALNCFKSIADTSKILFNIGIIHATLGEHTDAVDCYQRAVQLDQYLAVAYFQQGVSNFLLGDFEEALANFNDTLLYLRGNNHIDYEQLGLKFKLYSCEALFNRGLCYIYLQQKDAGLQDLIFAAREKVVPDHDVIDEAIKEQAEGYTVFSIPVGVVYRPSEAKVKNLKQKDYLGKSRLVAQQDQIRTDPRRALAAIGVDDRSSDKLSYAALNLVRPNMASRSRQQSEPPMNRIMFPPTPPPEQEREPYVARDSMLSQGSGVQSNRPSAKTLRLDLGVAAFERPEKQRAAPRRTESERPAFRRELSTSSRRSDRREERYEQPYVQEDPVQAYSHGISPAQAYQGMSPAHSYNQGTSPAQSYSQGFSPAQTTHQRSRTSAHALRGKTMSITEEGEEDDTFSISEEPLAFEIVSPGSQQRRPSQRRVPEVRKLRIKVHGEDMRYVMTTPQVQLHELVGMIAAKFALVHAFKLKIKDEEGDMVTVSDQDDLDMAIATSKTAAMKERADMGKMEIWVH
ncbi:hypothetical protein AMS68_000893 [Peltaster fructicola]|uniref:PB1 domain-containing protein n=1 Tax=Peltaster fructicola TaxID=286661 RepID=A0A6H0XKY6_9PEZI|nr:hypothetical protein AMS68_000893 [Peltaster fructicola]